MKPIQLNEFVKLHDGKKIVYCKLEFLQQAYEDIQKKKHDVVLIIGGSDRCVYNHHLESLPSNVKKLFSLNCHIDKELWGDIVCPIPLGIEITETINWGEYYGCLGYVEGEEKLRILSDPPFKEPSKFIYANFRVNTNPTHRRILKEAAIKLPYITWHEPHGRNDQQRYNYGPPYIEFVNDILEHEAVLCAQGNDRGDNLRIYETLYLSRVPLTFNPKMYENLHHIFPIALVSDLSELDDHDGLRKRVEAAKRKTTKARKYLDFSYWEDVILNAARKV